METIENMVTRALDMTGRPGGAHFAEGERMIQSAYQRAMAEARLAYKTTTVTITAIASGDYSLHNDFGLTDLIAIKYVNVATSAAGFKPYTLTPITPDMIYDLRAIPTQPQFIARYAVIGIDTFIVYPNFTTGDTVQFHYYYRPVDVVDDDSMPPEVFPPELSDYVVYQAASWLAPAGKGPRAGIASARFYQERADMAMMELKRFRNRVGGSKYALAQPGYRLTYLGARPGIYPPVSPTQ